MTIFSLYNNFIFNMLYPKRLTFFDSYGILYHQKAQKAETLRGGLIHQRSCLLKGVKSMKHLIDKIVGILPGVLVGVLIGFHFTGYLATYMPLLVILTVLVFLARLA